MLTPPIDHEHNQGFWICIVLGFTWSVDPVLLNKKAFETECEIGLEVVCG